MKVVKEKMNVRDVLPQVENKWEIEIGLESLPLSQRAIFPFGKTKPPRHYRLESDPNPKFRIICSSNLEIVTNAVVVAIRPLQRQGAYILFIFSDF